MATITSNASGAWATGATWVGGTKPADDDVVVIAAIDPDENNEFIYLTCKEVVN